MAEIPKNTTEIGGLLQEIHDYIMCQIEPKYKIARPLEDEPSSMMENIILNVESKESLPFHWYNASPTPPAHTM